MHKPVEKNYNNEVHMYKITIIMDEHSFTFEISGNDGAWFELDGI